MIYFETFVNDDTLNIFTDASMSGKNGCYGAIATVGDHIIDECFRIVSNSTNNDSEIKGVRAGVRLAIKYMDIFPYINIFSDSQLAIYGIRDRIVGWTLRDNVLYTQQGTRVSSQDVYIQIVYMILKYNLHVTFYHCKGHTTFTLDKLIDAEHVFEVSNGIREQIDMNFIKFISKWNNEVDKRSRNLLKQRRYMEYTDPIFYIPEEFDREGYHELASSKFSST